MDTESLRRISGLLASRNAIDADIGTIVGRPMTSGHLGEWIAAQIFDIELEVSASTAAIDGIFRSGPLKGATVNVKWYLKQEGVLDMSESDRLDYYLVLAGPPPSVVVPRATVRPWCIDSVFLFDARQLRDEQIQRGVKRGIASSVRKHQWAAAEVYPAATNPLLPVDAGQASALALFRP